MKFLVACALLILSVGLWSVSTIATPVQDLPWSSHINNLTALLQHRSQLGRVSLVTFNVAWSHMLENYLHSIHHYGKVHNVLVVATTTEAADYCFQHNVPCWNATQLLHQALPSFADGDQLFQQGAYQLVVWSKVFIAREVIMRGYHIHFGDCDTVYYRDVWQNLVTYTEMMHADGVAMAENDAFNTGNYFFFSNHRTKAFFDAWVVGAKNTNGLNDQTWLPNLAGKSYMRCCTYEDCKALSTQPEHASKVRIAVHTSQSDRDMGRATGCPPLACCPPRGGGNICDHNAIYVHAICMTGYGQKSQAFKQLGLWFRDNSGTSPRQNLPCTNQLVWQGLISDAARTAFKHHHAVVQH